MSRFWIFQGFKNAMFLCYNYSVGFNYTDVDSTARMEAAFGIAHRMSLIAALPSVPSLSCQSDQTTVDLYFYTLVVTSPWTTFLNCAL